jgi:predicted Zn-dependent peptidase
MGIMLSDTLSLPGPGLKMKMKSSRKDSFSGGVIMTFENGFKVVYKNMPTSRTLHYSLSLNGGYANIENLERGEGAYMSDYLDCCWISGMKGRDFKNLLKLSGMTMNARVGLSKTIISGQVSDRNADLLMKGLLAVTGTVRSDTTVQDYYARSERLRLDMALGSDLRMVIDSLMCPGYRYTRFRTDEGVRENTFAKAHELYANITSKMNDGVLVIVGDMPETDLKKLLQMYVGGFKTRSVASRRLSMKYHPVSGRSMYSVEGEKDAMVMAMSGILPMTNSNHFASEIAAMMLERKLKENFRGRDISVRLSSARSIFPDERISVYVLLDGVCGHDEAQEVMDLVAGLAKETDAVVMKACKEYIKNVCALQAQTPEYWLRVIPLRHLEGKDFTTGCADKIDAVTADQIKNVFGVLQTGAGVEYVIKKKQ